MHGMSTAERIKFFQNSEIAKNYDAKFSDSQLYRIYKWFDVDYDEIRVPNWKFVYNISKIQ